MFRYIDAVSNDFSRYLFFQVLLFFHYLIYFSRLEFGI
jgi:hypothetical protein